MSKSKTVAKKDINPLAEFIDQGDAGAGMEHADAETFAIPFLRVLQSNSPQCDEADAAYIKGAKPGMLFNTVTQTTYDGEEGLVFLPCAFNRRFLRWAPRNAEGQGFKGELTPEEVARMRQEGEAVESEGRLYVADESGEVGPKRNDRLSDTRSHYGLVVEDGLPSAVLLALSSTQIRKSKQMMSMLSAAKVQTAKGMVTPPTWMNRVRITTVRESNDQGSWYGVRFEADGFLEDADLYAAGKQFHDTVMAGEVKVNFAAAEGDDAGEGDGKF